MEPKVKALLGELNFTILVLQERLEQAHKRIEELMKEKDESAKTPTEA